MWNQRYQTDEYIYGKQPNDFLTSVTDKLPKGKVLSLGEGEGRNGVYLAALGFQVTALDISDNGLKKARRLAKEHNVEIQTIVTDLDSYGFDENSFDIILSVFCHLPVKLRQKVHPGIVTSLRPGGFLVMEVFSKAQIRNSTGGPKSLDMLLSVEELEEELEGLQFEILREVERDVIEGIFHSGKSSVIQVLGRKK